jgi:hypothetical protein
MNFIDISDKLTVCWADISYIDMSKKICYVEEDPRPFSATDSELEYLEHKLNELSNDSIIFGNNFESLCLINKRDIRDIQEVDSHWRLNFKCSENTLNLLRKPELTPVIPQITTNEIKIALSVENTFILFPEGYKYTPELKAIVAKAPLESIEWVDEYGYFRGMKKKTEDGYHIWTISKTLQWKREGKEYKHVFRYNNKTLFEIVHAASAIKESPIRVQHDDWMITYT